MLVWSAFHGVKKNWFLSVDASCIHTSELGTSSDVKIGATNTDDDCRGFKSDANRNDILSLSLQDGAAEKNAVSEMIAGPKVDKHVEKITDSHRSIYSEEHFTGAESHAKKKRKVSHSRDECQNSSLGGGGAMFHPDGKDGKHTISESIVKVSGVRNDQYDVEGRLVSEGISPPAMAETSNMDSQNINGSDRRNENNGFESVFDYGLGQDVPTQHSGVVSVMVPDSSARLMDVSGGAESGDVNTAGVRRKKKKVQNTVAKVQDTTDTENFGKCDQMEGGQGFSLKNDHEVMMLSNSKAPGQVEPDLALAEASLLQDAEKYNFSIANSQKLLDYGREEDNVLESKLNYELDQGLPTVQSGGICTNKPNSAARLVDAAGGIADVNTDGKKRKKKKLQTTLVNVQDTRDVEQIGNGEMEKSHTDTINSEEKEEGKGASMLHDYEVILPLDSKAPDHVDPNFALKEASIVRDADAAMEPEISSGIRKRKKKKREKKPLGTSIENSGITEIQNGIRGSWGLPSPSSDHTPKETGKEENIKLNEGKDVPMKLLDGSNHDAQDKVWDVNRRETDLEIKTQTEQTVVDVSVVKRIMAENTKSSAGDCNTDFPTAETENTMESNQADKGNGNTENGDRKAKKKRKKKKHTATDVLEKEVIHVDSSQILPRKSEEEADKMHELAVNIDDVAENSAKGSEGINFKQYFVPGQLQNKVDSSVQVRNGTKLKRSSKRANDDDLPSVNISTELQNSSKSFENRKTKKNSYRKDSGRTKGDSTQNSDWDAISHHSFERSSVAPEIEVKDSSPSELRETTRQKLNGIVAAPTIRNKNPSLDKSSLQKKILLAKSGAIFQDISGESSGDENGIMHSNDRTLSSSDNSSMSGDSARESELSQSSTSKGMFISYSDST